MLSNKQEVSQLQRMTDAQIIAELRTMIELAEKPTGSRAERAAKVKQWQTLHNLGRELDRRQRAGTLF